MSMTTTEIYPTTVREILQDYALHHSEETESSSRIRPQDISDGREPLSWLYDRRRIPAYRSPSRNHSLSGRPAGRNPAESLMVVLVFLGVHINSVSHVETLRLLTGIMSTTRAC